MNDWNIGIPKLPGIYVWRLQGREPLGLRTLLDNGNVILHGWINNNKEDIIKSDANLWEYVEWKRVVYLDE